MVTQERLVKLQQVRQDLTKFFHEVSEFYGGEQVVTELMDHRGYDSQEMFDTLMQLGVINVNSLMELSMLYPHYTLEQFKDWGLTNDKGNFILTDRYIVPIKDIAGNIIALVGWHPQGGSRKYVTTPTLGFSRDVSFFNYDHAYRLSHEAHDGVVFLVEGIFDAISLRSLGLPAIANQGLEMSSIKSRMLSRFKKVVAVPDNDNSGRSVNPFLNHLTSKGANFIWRIPVPHVFVLLPERVKDVDEFVKGYEGVREDLEKCKSASYLARISEEVA